MPGGDQHLLSGLQTVVDGAAVDFKEDGAPAGELLHDEAFAAEDRGTQLLLEDNLHLDAGCAGKKRPLLNDDRLFRRDFNSQDITGEAGGKGNETAAVAGGIVVLKRRLAGKDTAEELSGSEAPAVAAAPAAAAPAPAAKPAAPAGAAGSIVVKAPMPGTVVNVVVSAGQAVKSGDDLVFIEAMKMETPVKAPQDGTVATIDVAKGEAVDSGKVLVTLN